MVDRSPTEPPRANRRRVLIVIDSLVPGGAEHSTVSLVPLLADRGFVPELATLHARPGLQDRVRDAGIVLHELNERGRLSWLRQLQALLAVGGFDLVHTSLFEADICGRSAAALSHVPVVTTLPTEAYGSAHLGPRVGRRMKIRACQVADASTARLARRLHAVSGHVADTMSRRLLYPRDRIDVVFRGRPAELAAAGPGSVHAVTRTELGWGEHRVVLAVARHDEAKGLDRLVEAWPLIKACVGSARLVVAGRPGSHTPDLRKRAQRAGLDPDLTFLGHREDVQDLLAQADAFVLPSRREGLPGALIEAMAAGVPAVVSDLPQVREVVTQAEASIVNAGDPVALAAAVTDILVDPAAAAVRAALARDRFLSLFTLDRSADGMAQFYERALSGRQR